MPASISTSLYYRVDGPENGKPVLLLHGGPGASHDYLYPQMLELARDHRVYTYDQRGGGQSKTNDSTPVTWETQVADLAALITEFGIGPATLVGYSWGALLAMLYAIGSTRDPALPGIERMALISPAPITRQWREQFEARFAERSRSPFIVESRAALMASTLRESDPDAYRQRSFELSVAGYFHDARLATNLTPFRVVGRVQQSIWSSLGNFDLRSPLCAVRCPALVVYGESDPIPHESALAAAEALGAELVELRDCGHVPYVEQPEALFKALRRFLGEQHAARKACNS